MTDTPYTIKYSEPVQFARGYRVGKRLYVSHTGRLTPSVKRAVSEDMSAHLGNTVTWDDLPVTRWDDVTMRGMIVRNNESGETRVAMDYTHNRGCGEIPNEDVRVLHV